ncbi:MAG: hypothetical protein ACTSO9_20475 [Candidatus Helarchaeota archaeon]
MAGWRTVAKNEIRLWTNKFRKNRKQFFYILTLIVVAVNVIFILLYEFWTTPLRQTDLFEKLFTTYFIIPHLSNSQAQQQQLQAIFLNTNIFSSLVIQLIPPVMQLLCFFIFFMAFTYPIQTSIQQLSVSHFEIVLSAPIKAKDMMLGNFLGRVPIYAFASFIFVPILWTLTSLFVPLTELSYITLEVVILVLFIIGTFLGTISASYISLKLGQSESGAEKAKAYLMLFGIIVAIPIFTMSSFPFIFTDPNVQFILKFIPTTWFGDIITFSIIPNYMTIPELLLFVGLASIFSIGIFGLSYKFGDRFYSLELGTHTQTVKIIEENSVYKLFRRFFGLLFVTQLKEFFRRKENLIRLIYSTVIAMLVPISTLLFSGQNQDLFATLSGDTMSKEYPLLLTGWIFAVMIGPMLGSTIMVRSKDMVWIFKKSPRGISSLVYPFIQVNFLMTSIMTIPVTLIVSIIMGNDLLYSTLFLLGTIVWVFSALAVAVGVQCWRPAFKEKSPKMSVNILITMGFFFVILILMIFILDLLDIYSLIVFPLSLLIISLAILHVGMNKLETLE